MGFYDVCDAVTGVSLLGSRRVAVVVLEARRRRAGAWTPVWAPIFGAYDRFGSIDRAADDAHARGLLTFFQRRLAEGSYVVAWDDMPMTGLDTIEDLLRTVERGVSQGYTSAALDGTPLSFALFDREVWLGAVEAGADSDLRRVGFPWPGTLAERVHAESGLPAGRDPQLDALADVDRFFAEHGVSWAPTRTDGQHGLTDTVPRLLARARGRWRRIPAIERALDRYAALLAR